MSISLGQKFLKIKKMKKVYWYWKRKFKLYDDFVGNVIVYLDRLKKLLLPPPKKNCSKINSKSYRR